MRRKLSLWACTVLLTAWTPGPSPAQQYTPGKEYIETRIRDFFTANPATLSDGAGQARMLSYKIDNHNKTLTITASDQFAMQDFTEKSVRNTYKRLAKALPKPYNKYELTIITGGLPIEELVPGSYAIDHILHNAWGEIEYDGDPWVSQTSRPYSITHGLQGRHLSVWASHGRYYDQKKGRWQWQRPNLFCTTEDLFTQTFVVPYLLPMLERAGAVVYSPRERDWQTSEALVDNDRPQGSAYTETEGRAEWKDTGLKGFAPHDGTYHDGEDPFHAGTARMAKTTGRDGTTTAAYQPTFPDDGRYAVYVSYQTLPKSVPDAEYIVYHRGEKTVFHVNQRMGGSTWVYLGTFDFDKGSSPYNRVVVTNHSASRGVVTTDAVRFGGGMGNISRGGSTSGLPRCLEGARYSAQWSGVPYRIYSTKGGSDDYGDDINVRPLSTNWLAGGSVYVPTIEGKGVPIELSLAVHSDAGFSPKDDIVGSLAICTTSFNNGRLSSGISRMASKDLADALLSGLNRDIRNAFGRWNRRELFDRNYSETRNPEVPSAIIETMSHQNFADMALGHDPNFKFTLARSIYKTLLRYIDHQHGRPCVVQPLAPNNFRIELIGKDKVRLSWLPVTDPSEPTASPTAYNVYTATGRSDFDNGRIVRGTSCVLDIEPGTVYSFRVAAVNRGGESFPTAVLSAYAAPKATKTVMVIDGFQRLSGPAVINEGTRQGFDLDDDIGVSRGLTAGWSGRQTAFDKSRAGKEGPGALGYCGNEMAGQFIMGNTFDYVRTHADAIASSGQYNIVSASKEAVENGTASLDGIDCVDIAFGLQQDDGHSLVRYKTFTPALQTRLTKYVQGHGTILASGAYIVSDMRQDTERQFLSSILKIGSGETDRATSDGEASGLGLTFNLYRQPNALHYAAPRADTPHPTESAFVAMQYPSGADAAVAYKGAGHRSFAMGFPFECIKDKTRRSQIMQGILQFLLK